MPTRVNLGSHAGLLGLLSVAMLLACQNEPGAQESKVPSTEPAPTQGMGSSEAGVADADDGTPEPMGAAGDGADAADDVAHGGLEGTPEFADCLAQTPGGPITDGIVILQVAHAMAWDPLLREVQANGHSISAELRAIEQLIIDVEDPASALTWVCRYKLGETTRDLVTDAWPNISLSLSGTQ